MAKVINFGVIYGLSAFGLAQQLGIDTSEAAKFIAAYFETLQRSEEISRRHRSQKSARPDSRKLFSGASGPIPEINSPQPNLRNFAERTAMNTPMQGAAADLIKLAMIEIDRRLAEKSFEARMILQVHDELLFEAPEEEMPRLRSLVKEVMEGVFKLQRPAAGGNEGGPELARHEVIRSYNPYNFARESSNGARATPRSVMIAAMIARGRDVEGRMRGADVGRNAHAGEMRDFFLGAFLDGNLLSGGERKIERRNRRGHVERNFIFSREHGDSIRADFIGRVAIARDPVRADHDRSDSSGLQEMADHVVGDERQRNVVLVKLPSGEPRALQIRPRFGNQHFDAVAALDGHANHAQRRADSAGRQSAGVALRHHAAAFGHELRAEAADAFVGFAALLDGAFALLQRAMRECERAQLRRRLRRRVRVLRSGA